MSKNIENMSKEVSEYQRCAYKNLGRISNLLVPILLEKVTK